MALLAALKLLLIAVLLAAGWKGGHFYPMLFVATVPGLSLRRATAGLATPVSPFGFRLGFRPRWAGVADRIVERCFVFLRMPRGK